MLEAQKLLAERFTGLRDSRAGSVFFIEHGLSETELERLSAAVRQAIWRHPPESSWWRACPLPLVVSARNGPRELDSAVSGIFLGFQAAKSR